MKFPRTPHLPGSRATADDVHTAYPYRGNVVVTEKMDGSNIMMSRDKFITRSGKTSNADWVFPARQTHLEIQHLIPKGYWLAGELVYWRKSVAYDALPAAFLAFGAMKGNKVLSWTETVELATQCGLHMVPVLAQDVSPAEGIKAGMASLDGHKEGFVVRPMESFSLPHYGDFVGKYVDSHHEAVATNRGKNIIL